MSNNVKIPHLRIVYRVTLCVVSVASGVAVCVGILFAMGNLTGDVVAYSEQPKRVLGNSFGLGSPFPEPSFTLTGEAVSDQFAYSVATAGDVNNDGYSDIVVGAPNYNSQNQGRIYVYLGSANGLGAFPDFIATGEDVLSDFGYSVSSAGDVNGDGYDEIIVGAPRYPDDNFRGRVYIYNGSPTGLGSAPSISYTGEANGDWLGFAIGSAGDVNNDGYSDVIMSVAPPTGNYAGKVYLYLGSSGGLESTPAFTVTGDFDTNFGFSVATAGDVNDDGYSDVIIGELGKLSTPFGIGHAYIYTGTQDGLSSTPAFTLTGEFPGDAFGTSVGTAGDTSGDGYSDIIVGAMGYPNNNNRGRAYVYAFTENGLSPSPIFTVTGESINSRLGYSTGTAGDMNGDGFDDVIIGADGYDDGINGSIGKTYVYFGSEAGLEDSSAFTATGSPHGGFGVSVDTAGDTNSDGYADIVIGALEWGSPGRAFIYLGSDMIKLYLPIVLH